MLRGLAVVERGHDVPGRAPVAHQVERLEDAGDVEGLEIGGRAGGAEAEPLRSPRPSWSAPRSGPASRSGCRARWCGHGRCRSGRASTAGRRRSRGGTSRPPGCGRSPGSSRPMRKSVRLSGCRQDDGRLVQFCACRKPTRCICRMDVSPLLCREASAPPCPCVNAGPGAGMMLASAQSVRRRRPGRRHDADPETGGCWAPPCSLPPGLARARGRLAGTADSLSSSAARPAASPTSGPASWRTGCARSSASPWCSTRARAPAAWWGRRSSPAPRRWLQLLHQPHRLARHRPEPLQAAGLRPAEGPAGRGAAGLRCPTC